MGSEKNLNSLATHSSALLMSGGHNNHHHHEHINNLLGLDLAKIQSPPKFEIIDRFAGLIPKALEEIRKEKDELAEADKLLESLKAKYENDKFQEQIEASLKSKSSNGNNKKFYEYRDRKSPYSTGASTPMRSPPRDPLIMHDQVLSTINSKTCSVCQKIFASRQSMLRHIARKHPEKIDDETSMKPPNFASDEHPYKCSICSKGFDRIGVLAQHQKRHQPKSLECPHCHRRYAFKNEFRKHLTRVHKIEYDEIPEDITIYGQLTEEGEKFEQAGVGRPSKLSNSNQGNENDDTIKEDDETNITPRNSDIDPTKALNGHEVDDHDDDDGDFDDLLLEKLNSNKNKVETASKNNANKESTKINGITEVAVAEAANEDEDDDDEDLDKLLLQKLNN